MGEQIVLTNCRTYLRWMAVTLVLCVSVEPAVFAQSGGASKVLTLEEAVDFSLKNYPAVRASLEQVRAADAGIGLAKTNYLPRADMVWQTNRATDNNITGLVLPQSIIAPISGPVPASTSNRSAWGSAAGLLFSWEPFDFGYRGAKVDAARAGRDRATAEASLTRLDVAVATVNAYLTVLAAQRTVRAAEADVERRDTFDKAVRVLVDNQLRAGADASRADAELARAKVNLARARQQEKIGSLLGPPPDGSPLATPLANNPVAEAQHARVEEAQAQVHVLDRSYYPKFYLQSSVYGRGSGWDPAGKFEGGTAGLGPDRSNWAVGLSVTFPVFDIFAIRSRKAVESANERAEAARYDQALQDLTGQLRKAQASLEGLSKALAVLPRIPRRNWTRRGQPKVSNARATKQGSRHSSMLPTRRAFWSRRKPTRLLRGSRSGRIWRRSRRRKATFNRSCSFSTTRPREGRNVCGCFAPHFAARSLSSWPSSA